MNIFFSFKLASGVRREENVCADTWWYNVCADTWGRATFACRQQQKRGPWNVAGRQQQVTVVASAPKKIGERKVRERTINSLFVRLISHQPAVLFSQNKPATSNQPTVLLSHNKPAPVISHQPNEQAVKLRTINAD
jgi:hypothetical protein